MKSKITFFLLLIAYSLLVIPSVFAECTNSYGSSVECPPNRIEVNKKVRHPTDTNLFVENLTSNDTRYSPADTVEYEIAVTNTSNVDYTEVTVTDTLPQVLSFMAGPGLTYKLTNLKAGETIRTRFTAKIKDATHFTNDLTCNISNVVKVTGPNNQTDEDTASLCVQTKVLGATTLPVAGFETWMLTIPIVISAFVGMVLLLR